MKLEKLKKQTLVITTPKGIPVEITFMDFVQQCYNDAGIKGATIQQFLLANKELLVGQWEHAKQEIEKQVAINNKPVNKLLLKVKYALKTLLYKVKSLFKTKKQ